VPKRKRTRTLRHSLFKKLYYEIQIVHGTVLDSFSDFAHRIGHAWLEYDGLVYDSTFSIIAPVEEWYAAGSLFQAVSPPGKPAFWAGSAEAKTKYPLDVAVRTCFRHTQGPWYPEEVEWRP